MWTLKTPFWSLNRIDVVQRDFQAEVLNNILWPWCCFMCNKCSRGERTKDRRGKEVSADAYPSTFSLSIWNTQLPTVSYICREERNMRCRQETLKKKREDDGKKRGRFVAMIYGGVRCILMLTPKQKINVSWRINSHLHMRGWFRELCFAL
jgi:hypothetical protein